MQSTGSRDEHQTVKDGASSEVSDNSSPDERPTERARGTRVASLFWSPEMQCWGIHQWGLVAEQGGCRDGYDVSYVASLEGALTYMRTCLLSYGEDKLKESIRKGGREV